MTPLPTPEPSTITWQALSDRPHLDSLKQFAARLKECEGSRVSFVVLYGSMARGDWGRGSDYDVLVGLSEPDPLRFIDRLRVFDRYSDGLVEALVYGSDEIEKMFRSFNSMVLAALRDGVVLWDDGAWARYQRRYQVLLDSGHLERRDRAWRWDEAAMRMAAEARG